MQETEIAVLRKKCLSLTEENTRLKESNYFLGRSVRTLLNISSLYAKAVFFLKRGDQVDAQIEELKIKSEREELSFIQEQMKKIYKE